VSGIRMHGRGGQGAVVASKILAKAYFAEGLYVQAFPAFGMERRGAAVAAYVRVDTKPALARGDITEPDVCLVLDPALLEMVDVTAGLKDGAIIILNYPEKAEAPELGGNFTVALIDANQIALSQKLGSALAPIVNTVVLGAYAKVVSEPHLEPEHLFEAIEQGVPSKKEENVAAAREAYARVKILEDK
jgi:pyruvate ferredoxin oxidoreductase gamma subunit